MTSKLLDEYRRDLNALARKLERALAHDQQELMNMEETDLPGGPVPATGETIDSGTLEVEAGLEAKEETLLADVRAALVRMDAGKFGKCASCGAVIAHERLKAVPYATHCIRCARASAN